VKIGIFRHNNNTRRASGARGEVVFAENGELAFPLELSREEAHRMANPV
jgi:hypothetical protein